MESFLEYIIEQNQLGGFRLSKQYSALKISTFFISAIILITGCRLTMNNDNFTPKNNSVEIAEVVSEKTENEGITYRTKKIRRQISEEKAEQLNSLLIHSRNVIDAYQLGSSQVIGFGDYQFSYDGVVPYLEEDFEVFKNLFKDELNTVIKELNAHSSNDIRINVAPDDYQAIFIGIYSVYEKAIKGQSDYDHNLGWGTTLEISRARLETFRQYLFNPSIELEDVPKVKRESFVSLDGNTTWKEFIESQGFIDSDFME